MPLAAKSFLIASAVFVLSLGLIYTRIDPTASDDKIRPTTDLATFVAASRTLSRGGDPYDLSALKQTITDTTTDVLPYVYTPVVAQLLTPFNSASVVNIQRWWLILSAASLSLFIVMLMSLVERRPSTFAALLYVALPIHFTLISGQIEAFLAVIVLGAIWAHLSGRSTLAGLLLGAALVTKHAIVFLVLWFLIERAHRTVVVAALTVVAAVGVSMLVGGADVWFSFLHFTRSMTHQHSIELGFDPHGGYNLSVTALLLRMGLAPDAIFRAAGPVFLAIVTGAVLWYKNRRPLDEMQTLTIMSLAAVLALPFMWSHHLLYVGLAFATIFARAITDRTLTTMLLMGIVLVGLQIAPGMPVDRVLRMLHVEIPVSILGSLATVFLIGAIITTFSTPLRRTS